VAAAALLLALLAGLATLVGLRRVEPRLVLPATDRSAEPDGLHAVERRHGQRVVERQ